MKIITISREFGSGGRELGKRMADVLGFDYYDKEILTRLAEQSGLDQGYIEDALENHGWQNIPLSFNLSFSGMMLPNQQTDLLKSQTQIIESIAQAGKDCVIVGRHADVILSDYHPFNIFVCADSEAKIQRCMERASADESYTHKEMEKQIRAIDKSRAQIRDVISDSAWGERTSYHLTVNTTGWNLRELAPAVSAYATAWFTREEQ